MKTQNNSHSQQTGIRLIAAFEALKGGLIMIAGIGLLSLVHKDLQALAEHLVAHLHLNPAGHYPQIFIEAVSHINDSNLRLFALFAFLDAVLRLIIAYGLWRLRVWAEWLAIIAGSIYVPIEIYELFQKLTVLRAAVLLINILIVGYLIRVRLTKSKYD